MSRKGLASYYRSVCEILYYRSVCENGEKFFKRVDTVYGNPNKPLTRDAHLAKFRRNWKASAISLPIEDGEEIIKMIDDLEEVEDIRALIDLATG